MGFFPGHEEQIDIPSWHCSQCAKFAVPGTGYCEFHLGKVYEDAYKQRIESKPPKG